MFVVVFLAPRFTQRRNSFMQRVFEIVTPWQQRCLLRKNLGASAFNTKPRLHDPWLQSVNGTTDWRGPIFFREPARLCFASEAECRAYTSQTRTLLLPGRSAAAHGQALDQFHRSVLLGGVKSILHRRKSSWYQVLGSKRRIVHYSVCQ